MELPQLTIASLQSCLDPCGGLFTKLLNCDSSGSIAPREIAFLYAVNRSVDSRAEVVKRREQDTQRRASIVVVVAETAALVSVRRNIISWPTSCGGLQSRQAL
jgi:hypothetical protein